MLTREDLARLPFETKVLIDMWLEQGVEPLDASDDCTKAVSDAAQRIQPYVLTDGVAPGWGVNAATYALWNRPTPMVNAGLALEQSLKLMLYRNCPLHDCEAFDFRQNRIPVAQRSGDLVLHTAVGPTIVRVSNATQFSRNCTVQSIQDQLLRLWERGETLPRIFNVSPGEMQQLLIETAALRRYDTIFYSHQGIINRQPGLIGGQNDDQ